MKKEKSAAFFQELNQTLKNYERAIPFLLIDLNQLDENINQLQNSLNPQLAFRLVVKSLPSNALVKYIMQRTDTNNLMVFHQPFLTQISATCSDQVDILIGKPMPIKTAAYYFNNLPNNPSFNPFDQIQWLVDTEERIREYIGLAKKLGLKLRLNLEIDLGLHRGGFDGLAELEKGLKLIAHNTDRVILSGLMGYDPHVVKLPSVVRSKEQAFSMANEFYETAKTLIKTDFAELWSKDLTFNGGGSPTLPLHQTGDSPLNDISAGSFLLKPTTFDIPTLSAFQPACYIAAPVLKKFSGTTLPALEKFKKQLNLINSSYKQSFFISGGFWKADYCYPFGVKQNKLFGASTNQTMLNAPASAQLEVDDFVFLRPHQSEFVLLQFGNLLAIRNGVIEEEWAIFNNW